MKHRMKYDQQMQKKTIGTEETYDLIGELCQSFVVHGTAGVASFHKVPQKTPVTKHIVLCILHTLHSFWHPLFMLSATLLQFFEISY